MKYRNYYHLLLTCLLFLALFLPRFNGNQLIVKQAPYDAKYYENYVEYFRGNQLNTALRPATNWRFLVPLTASYLPFSALTSINIINGIFLALGLIVFYCALQYLNIISLKKWQALWLFLFSFPMFYYSSISYVDTSLFLFIAMSVYSAFKKQEWLFILAILLGLCVKETIAIAIPFYLFYHFKKNKKNAIYVTTITVILYIIGIYIIRKYAPISIEATRYNFWKFNFNSASINFNRFNSWFSVILSFGIVGFLFLIKISKKNIREIYNSNLHLACLASISSVFLLYLLSYFSTIADGRIIWLSYFYMLMIIFSENKFSEVK